LLSPKGSLEIYIFLYEIYAPLISLGAYVSEELT